MGDRKKDQPLFIKGQNNFWIQSQNGNRLFL